MMPTDPATWWTAFGAVWQAIGAIATFAAVAVSLWVVFSERAIKATVSVGIRVMFAGDGSPGVYLVSFSVINTGMRPFVVNSVGWRTGWLSRGPLATSHQYAIQNTSVMIGSSRLPVKIEAGTNEAFHTLVSDMKRGVIREARTELFGRKVAILGNAPIHAQVFVTGRRRPITVRVPKSLAEFLRTGEHIETTDELPR